MGATETLGIILQTQANIKTAVSEMKSGFDDIKKNAESSAKEVEANYEEAFRSIRNASAIAFAGLSAAIGFSTREAIQAEDSLNKVRAAVILQGGDWGEWKDKVKDATGSMQEFTRFGDEELQDTLARMIQLTGDVKKSYDNLGLATDLAAGLQIDLGTAGDMVAKAMQGNLGMLGRYMPALAQEVAALGETATMGEKAALIMDRLSRFTGAAGEDAKTTGGQIAILKNQVGEAAEGIGNAFLPVVQNIASALLPIVKGITDWANEHKTLVANLAIGALAITGFATAVSTIALTGGAAATAIKSISAAIAFFKVLNPEILLLSAALAAVAGGAYLLYRRNLELTQGAGQSVTAFNLLNESGEVQGQMVYDLERGWITYEEAVKSAIQTATNGAPSAIKPGRLSAPGIPSTMNVAGLEASTREVLLAPLQGYTEYDLPDFLDKQKQAWRDEADEEKRIAKELYDARLAMWNENTASMQAGYSTFAQSLLETDMTGRERANAVWRSFASTAIGQIVRMSSQYVVSHLAMKTVAVSTAATEQAAIVSTAAVSAGAAASEQASAVSVAVAWMKAAYAKLTAFYSFLGPFAPAAAIGTIGAAMAGIAMVTKEALGFERGGVVPGSGNRDSVPAMLTPGERVLTVQQNQEFERGQTGGGNQYHIHMDRDSTTDDVLKLRRLVQSWIVPMIEDARSEGRFRPAGVPA